MDCSASPNPDTTDWYCPCQAGNHLLIFPSPIPEFFRSGGELVRGAFDIADGSGEQFGQGLELVFFHHDLTQGGQELLQLAAFVGELGGAGR